LDINFRHSRATITGYLHLDREKYGTWLVNEENEQLLLGDELVRFLI